MGPPGVMGAGEGEGRRGEEEADGVRRMMEAFDAGEAQALPGVKVKAGLAEEGGVGSHPPSAALPLPGQFQYTADAQLDLPSATAPGMPLPLLPSPFAAAEEEAHGGAEGEAPPPVPLPPPSSNAAAAAAAAVRGRKRSSAAAEDEVSGGNSGGSGSNANSSSGAVQRRSRAVVLRVSAGQQAGAAASAAAEEEAARWARERLADPIGVLVQLAEALAGSRREEAVRLFQSLREVASVYGDAAQRLSAYFLAGLQVKLDGEGGGERRQEGVVGGSVTDIGFDAPEDDEEACALEEAVMRASREAHPSQQQGQGAAAAGGGGDEPDLSMVPEPLSPAFTYNSSVLAAFPPICRRHVMAAFQSLMSSTPIVSFGQVGGQCRLGDTGCAVQGGRSG